MKLKTILFVALVALLASCSKAPQVVKASEIEEKGELATYKGENYTGDITTSDERCVITCKDGKPVAMKVLYADKKTVAIEMDMTKENSEPKMYDKTGKQITEPGEDNIAEFLEIFSVMETASKEFGNLAK